MGGSPGPAIVSGGYPVYGGMLGMGFPSEPTKDEGVKTGPIGDGIGGSRPGWGCIPIMGCTVGGGGT